MQILAGDIGGTNTRLALFDSTGDKPEQAIIEASYPSPAHPTIESILEQFLDQHRLKDIQRACFGLAGPVIDQVCETTNLPWLVSAQSVKQRFGFDQVWLLNDLEANAWGIDTLHESDIHSLNLGAVNASGNRSIISAGTGLGEAGLYWDGSQYNPFPSEGGHTDFSANSALEYALYESLAQQYGHVSWERLLSGPGIEAIYAFLLQYRSATTPQWLQQQINQIGVAPAVSRAAIDKADPIAAETMALFIEFYGREASNHALKIMATGGVYLGGGIAPQILPLLKEGQFMQAFLAKGRMQHIVTAMPVRIILNDKTALMGAAHFAELQD
ncbi:MAG: glucokinase [Candidatus Thiodiazotropha taylori]|uniref:Glucokinase n=1 Tax=Candidatus Thiodiazotropha taylori TaxID=2792791 RepID=A0A9E4KB08_9GAMM|nr:glucokinase [Candidatus Thiodiazotropha taylori]MCG7966059.1 glucokinase [Candidatus Thiodiazotropha taylori]MCG8029147.1 glucokinase [Candidatus Thiodiazotropha taylori]MCG8106492.1 glucokinase [Candidatus Thiodiazotropha taylori]MCG8112600.1 glucokinase [Candidatus Thiodiazotropha taylori]